MPTASLHFDNASIHFKQQQGHHSNLTFDKTIRPLLNQDKTMTMIAELQHKLALFNNKTAVQDHPSDPSHPIIQTKDVLQTITMLQDKIPAHPLQQVLYATTVED